MFIISLIREARLQCGFYKRVDSPWISRLPNNTITHCFKTMIPKYKIQLLRRQPHWLSPFDYKTKQATRFHCRKWLIRYSYYRKWFVPTVEYDRCMYNSWKKRNGSDFASSKYRIWSLFERMFLVNDDLFYQIIFFWRGLFTY